MSLTPLTPIRRAAYDAATYNGLHVTLYKEMIRGESSLFIIDEVGAKASLTGFNHKVNTNLKRIEPPRLNGVQRFFATFSLWYQYVTGSIPTTPGSRYKHGYGTFWYRLNGGDW